MRWEYRAVALWPRLGDGADAMNDAGDVTDLLNALGAAGWELAAVEWLDDAGVAEGRTLVAFMKRPVG